MPHLSNLTPFEFGFLKTYYEDETGSPFEKAPVSCLSWLAERSGEYCELLEKKSDWYIPNWAIDLLAYNYTVKGGMSTLVEALAQKLPQQSIKSGHFLTAIEKEENLFVLTFQTSGSMKQVRAESVIMTLPFSTLRHVKIAPSVGISENQRVAIQTLPYGTNSKIGIPLTATNNIYNEMLYHINTDTSIIGWAGENAVTLMVSAEHGRDLDFPGVLKIAQQEQPYLATQYPCIKDFGQPLFKNWSTDPFSLGSYSTMTVGCAYTVFNVDIESEQYKGMRQFAIPAGKLFFAGEHTRADGTSGYIEGAVKSRYKAAELLMKSL